jgi:exonuclease III
MVNVYSPAHDDKKNEFLKEIQTIIQSLEMPILLGGDFNMIRKIEQKSSGNVDFQMMDAFNEMISITELRELQRSGSRYTWSNKQTPLFCVSWIGSWFPIPGQKNLTFPLYLLPPG